MQRDITFSAGTEVTVGAPGDMQGAVLIVGSCDAELIIAVFLQAGPEFLGTNQRFRFQTGLGFLGSDQIRRIHPVFCLNMRPAAVYIPDIDDIFRLLDRFRQILGEILFDIQQQPVDVAGDIELALVVCVIGLLAGNRHVIADPDTVV